MERLLSGASESRGADPPQRKKRVVDALSNGLAVAAFTEDIVGIDERIHVERRDVEIPFGTLPAFSCATGITALAPCLSRRAMP